MSVPARARFRCHVRLDKVRDHPTVGGVGNAEVAVQKEVAQTAGDKLRVARFDMGKLGCAAVQHGVLLFHQDIQFGIGAVQQA